MNAWFYRYVDTVALFGDWLSAFDMGGLWLFSSPLTPDQQQRLVGGNPPPGFSAAWSGTFRWEGDHAWHSPHDPGTQQRVENPFWVDEEPLNEPPSEEERRRHYEFMRAFLGRPRPSAWRRDHPFYKFDWFSCRRQYDPNVIDVDCRFIEERAMEQLRLPPPNLPDESV